MPRGVCRQCQALPNCLTDVHTLCPSPINADRAPAACPNCAAGFWNNNGVCTPCAPLPNCDDLPANMCPSGNFLTASPAHCTQCAQGYAKNAQGVCERSRKM